MISTILTAIIAFASTNIDDLFLLGLLFSQVDNVITRKDITIGQFLGVGFLIFVSFLSSFGAILIPSDLIRVLGFLPIIIGILKLKTLWSTSIEDSNAVKNVGSMVSIALVTAANGGDNVGVYIPLFASYGLENKLLIVTIFFGMIGLWLVIAQKLVSLPALSTKIQKYGKYIIPFVLIAIGLNILFGFDYDSQRIRKLARKHALLERRLIINHSK
jgi:cadmium resistance protein CadD (predicted permease)